MNSETAKAPLSGWRVLNTRPAAQTEKWRLALQEAGADSARLALMEIAPLTDPAHIQAIKDRVMMLGEFQHAIFVSQNAATHGLHWIDQYWPQLPFELKFYAVGSATAAQLTDYGCRVTDAGGTMNSEALLALPALQDLSHQKVLIFRGLGGRPLLAERLSERGAQVDYCELYQRVFPRQGAIDRLAELRWGQKRDLVALHSGESLENWNQLLAELATGDTPNDLAPLSANIDRLPYNLQQLKQVPIIVPGQRVAQLAKQLQFVQIVVADNASDQAMIDALRRWCAKAEIN